MATSSNLGTVSYAEFLVLVSAAQQPSSQVPLGDDVNLLLLVNFPKMCTQVVAEVLMVVLEVLQAVTMKHLSIVC